MSGDNEEARQHKEFDRMQDARWALVEGTDTWYACYVHGGTFDVEYEPCMKCEEEAYAYWGE